MTSGNTGVGAQPGDRPVAVFISYARRDSTFARRLLVALEARGLRAHIDERDLPSLEDWRRELLHFIRQADAIVFVVSPRSMASPVCAWEVEQAASLGKRLAPVVLERDDSGQVPLQLARINYLYFDPPHDFERQADLLAEALQADQAWVKEHTRVGEAARRWHESGRPAASGLRGRELDAAEQWIAARPRRAPEITPGQREFVLASRRAATRRLRLAVGGALAVAALAFGLAMLAESNRRDAQARELAAMSQGERTQSPLRALALATCASELRELQETVEALMASHRALLGVTRVLASLPTAAADMAAAPDGKTLVVALERGKAVVISPQEPASRARLVDVDRETLTAVTATAAGNRWVFGDRKGALHVLSSTDWRREASFRGPFSSSISTLVALPDDVVAAGSNDNTLALMKVPEGRVLCHPPAAHQAGFFRTGIRALAAVPGQPRLASAGADGSVASWQLDRCSLLDRQVSPARTTFWSLRYLPGLDRYAVGDLEGGLSFVRLAASGRIEWVGADDHDTEALDAPGLDATVASIAAAGDGRAFAVGRANRAVTFWSDAAHGATSQRAGPMLRSPAHGRDVSRVVALPNGRFASLGQDAQVLLWDLGAVRPLFSQLRLATGMDVRQALSRNGRFGLAWNENGSVRAFDLATDRLVAEFARSDGARIVVGAVSDDGAVMAIGDESGALTLVRPGVGVVASAQSPLTESLTVIAFNPAKAGEFVTGNLKGAAARWRLSGASLESAGLVVHPSAVSAVAFSGDGRWVATAPTTVGNLVVHALDLDAPQRAIAIGETDAVTAVALDDTGARIAVASSEAKVRVFEGDLSTPRFTLDGHGDDVDALAFAPGSQLLATGGRDRRVILWRGQVRQWTIPDADMGWIRGLAIDPTASFIQVSGDKALTSRWSLKRDDWLAHGRRLLPAGWQSQCER